MKNWDVTAKITLMQNCIVRAATADEAVARFAAGHIEWGGDYDDPISEEVVSVTESGFQEARPSMAESIDRLGVNRGGA
jgi:hypothetical protein